MNNLASLAITAISRRAVHGHPIRRRAYRPGPRIWQRNAVALLAARGQNCSRHICHPRARGARGQRRLEFGNDRRSDLWQRTHAQRDTSAGIHFVDAPRLHRATAPRITRGPAICGRRSCHAARPPDGNRIARPLLRGHASLFLDRVRGILFAGDSFLHTIFTSPNKDVNGEEWIATLERYEALEIKTMVGTHGTVYSVDPNVARQAFVVERTAPSDMIRDKLMFMRWARDVVAEGERRLLPYSVIEACLFPWQRSWSWQNWFTDESGRLFSGGEFSRTHFVRSLFVRTPEMVPPRFPLFVRFVRWIQRRIG